MTQTFRHVPILVIDTTGLKGGNAPRARVLLDELREILTETARFFSPHADVWAKWRPFGIDGYCFVFDALGAAVAAEYARALVDEVAASNASSDDLKLQLRLALTLGDVELHNEQLLSGAVEEAREILRSPPFAALTTRVTQPVVLWISELFHHELGRDPKREGFPELARLVWTKVTVEDERRVYVLGSPDEVSPFFAAKAPGEASPAASLALLREKLDDFLAQEAIAVDPGIKFHLKKEIEKIRKSIAEAEEGIAQEDRDLLNRWRARVRRDHSMLIGYFQSQAGFDLLDPIYVQLDLTPDCHPLERRQAEMKLAGPRSLRRFLDLDPAEHPWVTRRWIVRGDPGAGKTTLLRHLAAKLAEEEDRRVPVFESLPRLLRQEDWLLDRVERQMSQAGEGGGYREALDRQGRQGRLLLLLDGLDEVPRDLRPRAESLLRTIAERWPESTLVVTTRPIGFQRPGSEFRELEIQPLAPARQQEFLARWLGRFDGDPAWERAQDVATLLASDRGLRELAANPLYLTLMALLFELDEKPHTRRSALYDQIFDLLLKSKHRPRALQTPMPRTGTVRDALRHLGYGMTRDNRDAESVEEVEDRLAEAESCCHKLRQEQRWRESLVIFLDDLAERTGILGPHDGPDADWRFWHRTFREALAAEALAQRHEHEGEAALLAFAREIRGDESRWGEPFALLAGRLDEPDGLVRQLVGVNRTLGLRALATAQDLRAETLHEILELSDDWEERRKVYARIPELVGEPEPTLALLDRLRGNTRNGNDLFFLEDAVASVAEKWPDYKGRTEQLRRRFFEHVPAPPEETFHWIETPLDGRVELWRQIPAGEFLMGSPKEESEWDDERPRHRVKVTAPFRMAVVTVTNAQYAAFDPERADASRPNHPVVNVTWFEATAFCRWLSAALPSMRGARLPTEEEWEYACRAGTTTRFWSGDNEADLKRVGWYDKNSESRVHRVGEKPANPWGLYDVHGNVWEWTLSPWTGDYSDAPGSVDPTAADLVTTGGVLRVIRGGGCWDGADGSRAAYRLSGFPDFGGGVRGFRVLLPPSPPRAL